MEKIEKVIYVKKAEIRRGIIITSTTVFDLNMCKPHQITVWYNPSNYDFDLKYLSEEVEANSNDYNEIVSKFFELRNRMLIEL
jgi:hypothetical protein